MKGIVKDWNWTSDKVFVKWLKEHNKLLAWQQQIQAEGKSDYGLRDNILLLLSEEEKKELEEYTKGNNNG